MIDIFKQLDCELLAAANLLRYAGDAAEAGRYIAAARKLISSFLASGAVVPGTYPAQRWVLTKGKDDIAFTRDPSKAYELMANCRDMADAVVYLEILAPLRVPMEMSRAKQDPISSFPAADANLPPRADTTASEGGAAGA